MSQSATRHHAVTPTSLIDEVMGMFQRGENALFEDLAQAAWGPQATLAAITGSLGHDGRSGAARDAT